ncbi:adh_short domain-containing protein [Cephalotus follicularis]|uniref:Adh_short domain-containing protein n=1 Tax=Cephalotus follicularis TaxID=3775 RepID=A0A1Q3CB79_CEPFO|nr:adh_short domain-containing protein [Cephalotus follicularis]
MKMKEMKEAVKFVWTVEFWRMGVLWTLSLLSSYFHFFFFSPPRNSKSSYPRTCPPHNSTSTSTIRTPPVCVITGASSGLGAAAAFDLSMEGFYVVLAGRSTQALLETMTDIKTRNKDAYLIVFHLDISSFQSIFKFQASLQQWLLDSNLHCSIQLLINNAGILATSSRITAEGYDEMLGTNYIGAFSLTKALLPLLENSLVPSRIVNVTSFTHRNDDWIKLFPSVYCAKMDKDTVAGKCFLSLKQYPCAYIYQYSKLCLLLFSYELHRQLALMGELHHVSVIAADPGVVETNIMREVPLCISRVTFIVLKLLGLLQSSKKGVSSILDAALAPPEISGVYFFGGKGRTINSSALSYNTKLAKELWTTSCDLFSESQLASNKTST